MMNFLNKSVSRLSTQRVFLSTKSDRSTKKIGAAGYFFLVTTFRILTEQKQIQFLKDRPDYNLLSRGVAVQEKELED